MLEAQTRCWVLAGGILLAVAARADDGATPKPAPSTQSTKRIGLDDYLHACLALARCGKPDLAEPLLHEHGTDRWEWRFLRSEVKRVAAWRDPRIVDCEPFERGRGALLIRDDGALRVVDRMRGTIGDWKVLPGVEAKWARLDHDAEVAVVGSQDGHCHLVAIEDLSLLSSKLPPISPDGVTFLSTNRRIWLGTSDAEHRTVLHEFDFEGRPRRNVVVLAEQKGASVSIVSFAGDRFIACATGSGLALLETGSGDSRVIALGDVHQVVPVADDQDLLLVRSDLKRKLVLWSPSRGTIWARERSDWIEAVDPLERLYYESGVNFRGPAFITTYSLDDGKPIQSVESRFLHGGDGLQVFDYPPIWVLQSDRTRLEFGFAPENGLLETRRFDGMRGWRVAREAPLVWLWGTQGLQCWDSEAQEQNDVDGVELKLSLLEHDAWRFGAGLHPLRGLDLAPDGSLILAKAVESDDLVTIDVASRSVVSRTQAVEYSTGCLLDGGRAAILLQGSRTLMFDFASDRVVCEFETTVEEPEAVFASDASIIVSGPQGYEVYDWRSGELLSRGAGHVVCAMRREGGGCIVGFSSGRLGFLDKLGNLENERVLSSQDEVSAVAFARGESGDKGWLIGIGGDLLAVDDKASTKLATNSGRITAIAATSDGSRIAATWRDDDRVRTFLCRRDGRRVMELRSHLYGPVRALRFANGDGDLVLCRGSGIHIWPVAE